MSRRRQTFNLALEEAFGRVSTPAGQHGPYWDDLEETIRGEMNRRPAAKFGWRSQRLFAETARVEDAFSTAADLVVLLAAAQRLDAGRRRRLVRSTSAGAHRSRDWLLPTDEQQASLSSLVVENRY